MGGQLMRKRDERETILLIGAGFGEPVGLKALETLPSILAPLTSNDPVVNLVRECYAVVSGDVGREASLEELLAHLKACADAARLIEDEAILSRALGLDRVHCGQVRSMWDAATAYCYRMMLEYYGPQAVDSSCERHFNALADALKHIAVANKKRLHLFTTNYDCLLHVMAVKRPDIDFFTRINDRSGHFEADWFPFVPEKTSQPRPQIYVHRLHGCVGWFIDERSPYRVIEMYGSGSRLDIKDVRRLLKMAIKLVSEESLGRVPAFSLEFENFKVTLEDCRMLVIWGHSFRDTELLRAVLEVHHRRSSHPFKAVFVDPYLEEKDVMDNMRSTLENVPGLSLGSFRPAKLDWVEQDGYPKLYELLRIAIGEGTTM
jgi:hypothetical protein